MSIHACPVCRRCEFISQVEVLESGYKIDCVFCGKYIVSRNAEELLNRFDPVRDQDIRPLVSHALRKVNYENDSVPVLTSDLLSDIKESRKLPTPKVQAEYLIYLVGKYGPSPGIPFPVSYRIHGAVIGACDDDGFAFVIQGLREEGLLKMSPSGVAVCLTFEGWERFQELERGAFSSNTKAFMAMKFGDAELNSMLESCFRPAVEMTGFSLEKLDDNPKAGLIDDRMRVEIRLSRFLIADLSHGNAGAYWEAGYAEGLGKPVIYTCKKSVFDDADNKPHFDTNHHLTVVWDESKPEEAATMLKATIRATIPEAKMEDS